MSEPWLKRYPDGVDWRASIPERPVYALLDDAVARFPRQPAIDFLGRTFTWGEIGALVDRAAGGFRRLGVGRGISVGLFLPNCPQYLVCYYAILKAGGTVVNFSPLYSEPELQNQIEDSHTDLMVTLNLKALYPKVGAMLSQSRLKRIVVGTMSEVLPFPKNMLFALAKRSSIAAIPADDRHLSYKSLLAGNEPFEPASINPREDIALLQYTGGTTGTPKGAMLTHANIYANTVQAGYWFSGVRPGAERMLGVLPFFHVFAMTAVMNLAVHVGAEIIMHPRFDLAAALKDIVRKKPSLMPGVPTMFNAICNHPHIKEMDLRSLKACISGGAPLPAEVRQKFEELTGAKLVEGYGLTESSPVLTCNPLVGVNKAGSIGLPLPGTRIIIRDPEQPERTVPQGEAGEICAIGPQVMKGYWQRPAETAEVLQDGCLRTGDIGYFDEDGYIFIIDRLKDMIISGGFKVYPRHVEEAIYQHPDVLETTVIGIPDAYRGESTKAFVKLKPGRVLAAPALLAFLTERLGRHEVPSAIEFRDELPKTMIGKLSKKELVAEERKKQAAKAG